MKNSEWQTKILAFLTTILAVSTFFQAAFVFASNQISFSQSINDGTQSIDIVDGSGNVVGAPAATFGGLTFSFNSQTGLGTLGGASQKIRIFNPTSDTTWTASIGALSGPTALWTSGSLAYDFNDSNASGTDDADGDTKGGRLTINPSVATVTGVPDDATCNPSTGITKGSSAAFQEVATAVSSITLLTGGASSTPYCRWDMTGTSLSQVVPASQSVGAYNLSFMITIA